MSMETRRIWSDVDDDAPAVAAAAAALDFIARIKAMFCTATLPAERQLQQNDCGAKARHSDGSRHQNLINGECTANTMNWTELN